jgi:sugar lactone lactonase YvrE
MRRLSLIALVVAGCSGQSLTAQDVELAIEVDATIADADIATVRSLDIAVTGAASAVMTYPLARPLARTERMIVHFSSAKGQVTVSVLARDDQSLVVMRGASASVNLASSGPHPTSATLLIPATGAHSASGIVLAPASFTIFTGQSLQLAAKDETVSWSAMDGGAIDDGGTFTAPATAGTYHAVAESALYPTDKASATLNVLSTGIALYAGTLGGAGTVDGNGPDARINTSSGMVLDGNSLYFTDNGQVLRRADIVTGDVTTIAGKPDFGQHLDGTGAGAGFVGPGGLAFDGNDTFYVAEIGCPCIRAINKAGVATTLAGSPGMYANVDGTGTGAQFRYPFGIAYDATKKLLYVSDPAAQTVRSVDVVTGAVVTIAGVVDTAGSNDGPAAMAKFHNPSQLVLDGGALYIEDDANAKIRTLDLGNKTVSTLATMITASSMAAAGSGKLALANPLRLIDESSGAITQLLDADKQLVYEFSPELAVAADGSLWYGAISKLAHYDVAAGKKIPLAGFDFQWSETDGPRATAVLGSLNSVIVRNNGELYVRDNRLLRVGSDGKLTAVAGAINAQLVGGDAGMAFGGDGLLYVPDRNGNVIQRVDVGSGSVTTYAGKLGVEGSADGVGTAALFNHPTDITADGNKLYLTDTNNQVIRAIDTATGAVTTLAGAVGMCGFVDMPGTQARFCGPQGIIADGAGNLYVTDNNSIRKIVIATGVVSPLVANNGLGFVDGPSGTAKLWGPSRMTFDAQKKYLYFTDNGNDAIRRVEMATGIVSAVAGGPGKARVVEGALPGSINQPGVIQFAATGELLVAVPRENALLQIRLP